MAFKSTSAKDLVVDRIRKENKEKWQEYDRRSYEKNKEEIAVRKRIHYQENKPKIREYNKQKYHTDSCYKLRKNVSTSIRGSLKGGKGGQSFLPYVDWTIEELEDHLESQFETWMTWKIMVLIT